MKKTALILVLLLTICSQTFAQHLGLTFQECEKHGISISNLDTIYQSAVHADPTQAVFKTPEEDQAMVDAYYKLIQDFSTFLNENEFVWEKQALCFNRIYFDKDGTIDYFLYNFVGTDEEKPSEADQEEFQRLLNLFIQDYQIPLTADIKFAQCSPVRYMPKQE